MHSSAVLCAGKNTVATGNAAPRFRVENPRSHADWDARFSSQPHFSFFHSAAWAGVLQRTYGFTPVYITATCGNQPRSLLPMMEVDSWLTGKRGVSLPFTDHCEPLGFSETGSGAVIEEALRQGRTRGWKYMECRSDPAMAGGFNGAPPSLSFFGHRLDLIPDTDALFVRFEGSVRRAIRKAEKSGLIVEIAQTLPALHAYYSLHCKTRKQHGQPPQPFGFFRNIQEEILARDLGVVISAKHNGRAVASAVFFHTPSEAIYKFGASDNAFQDLRANNLVMWEAIKWCARKGIKTLDFGRTSIANEGLRRYKLGWGAEEYPIHHYKYDLRRNEFVTDKDAASGWHVRAFGALPVFLARIVGAVLYKHVG